MATFNHVPMHLTRKAPKRLVLPGGRGCALAKGKLATLCWVLWELEKYELDPQVGECSNQRVRSGLFCKVTIQIKVLEKLPTQVFFLEKRERSELHMVRVHKSRGTQISCHSELGTG